ncbi:little elongation complex subunit 2 isoform X2 [Hoplias malabaricus]|uniref:little elongation complex subunit 2 isoform X2 n=1 Tax=Hoplias malabaricus TaxID=27720 RepID=UPI00346234FC
MELNWDQAPISGPISYSKDAFDRFSLAPTVKELWTFLQSADLNVEVKAEPKSRPVGNSSEKRPPKNNTVTPQNNSRTSQSSAGSVSDCNDTQSDRKTKEKEEFPDPKVPYPCYSTLTCKERLIYIQLLKSKHKIHATQVKNEVAEFMKYLQDVSKICADEYNYMPLGATRYLEEYFKASLDCMMNYPQLYSIHAVTSLTGGKFVSNISLNFEKQLLALGNIDIVQKNIIPKETQLSVDYDSVSAVTPPFKKASHFHRAISSDINAEKLCATYKPHVCLAKEALLQLLNNSAGYTEAWELPVCVKENPGEGNTPTKTVYIDPPLLKTQMTYRERNHLFHEESIKVAFKKTGSKPVLYFTSEDNSRKADFSTEEKRAIRVVSFGESGIDFDVDVTELESFGESYQLKNNVKAPESEAVYKNQTSMLDSDNLPLTVTSTPKNVHSQPLPLVEEELQEETVVDDSSLAKSDGDISNNVSEDTKSSNGSSAEVCFSSECPPSKKMRSSLELNMDSDEEKLIIDYPDSPLDPSKKNPQESLPAPKNILDITTTSFNNQTSDPTIHLSPTTPAKGTKKGAKKPRVSEDCDQLGHILRMQNAMLKSSTSKCQESPKAQTPNCKPPEPNLNIHPHSLVKPCVSSYLESEEGLDKQTAATDTPQFTVQAKRLLNEELLGIAEDEKDYEPPHESSVLYKLYSLLDLLLMVRSTVEIAHSRHHNSSFQAVPVHVLPKLEYQLCYGAESLTYSESCRLWAEQLLHSRTNSFIGRINAHTSQLVQLHELPHDWIQMTTCDFKPARCLNILHHILRKVMDLEKGSYLLGHKPGEAFVTIFKASDGKQPSRSTYDLQAVHCGPPVVPPEPKVPWVPLDPFHLMSFHHKCKRPPCTFPPQPPLQRKAGARKGAKQGNIPTRPPQRSQNSAARPAQKWKKKRKVRKALQEKGGQSETMT